jgi:hypothetical protein
MQVATSRIACLKGPAWRGTGSGFDHRGLHEALCFGLSPRRMRPAERIAPVRSSLSDFVRTAGESMRAVLSGP